MFLQKFDNDSCVFSFYVIFMTAGDFLFPVVNVWLKFVLLFVCFNNQFVLVEHCGFDGEEGFEFFGSEVIKGIAFVFYGWVFFFFCFFNLEFLFLHLLWNNSCRFLFCFSFSLSFSWLGGIGFCFSFLFRNFRLFEPLFNQSTIIK